MDFPCTQQLPDLDETFMSDDDQEKKQVGKLVVQNQSEGNVQEFPILEGENIIGRHSDCDINIEHGVALSKKHACIEAIEGQVVVFDCGSRNKTRIGTMKLKPDVRYAVRDREIIKFANIECTYLQNPETPEKKMKSDSVSSIASLIDATIATPSMKSTLLAVDTPETSTLINKKNQIDIDCIPDSQPVHDSFISESSFSPKVERVTFDSDKQNINYEVNNNKQSPIHCAMDSEIEESIISSPDSPQISLKLDESVSTSDSFLKFKNVDLIGNVDATVDPIVDTLVDPNVDKTVDTIVDSIVNQTFNTTVDTTVDSIVNTTIDTTVDKTSHSTVDTTVDRLVDITVETTVNDLPVKNDKTENFDKKVAENIHSTDTVEKNVDQLDTEVERSVKQFETSTENVDEKVESSVKHIDGHVETVDEHVEIVETLVENNSEEEECFKQSQEDIFKDDNDDDETDIEDDFVNNQEQCVFDDPYLAETQVISPIGAENCPGNTGQKILGITEDNSGKDLTKNDNDIVRDDIDITCGDDESIQKCAEGLVDSDLESDNDVSLLPNTNMIDTQHQHVPQMSGGILSMSCPKDNMENMNKCETVQDKINDVEHELEKDSKTISDKDKESIDEPIENTINNENVKTSHNEDIKSSHNEDIKVPINEDVMSSHVEEVKSFDVNDEIAKSSINTSVKSSRDKDIKSSHVEDKSIKSSIDKVCTSYNKEANSSHEGLKSSVEEGLKRSHNDESNTSIKIPELSLQNGKFGLKIASNTHHENVCLNDAGKLLEPEDVDQPQSKLENKSFKKTFTSNGSLKISKPETILEDKTYVNASKNEIPKCNEASIKNTSAPIESSSTGLLKLDGVPVSNKKPSLITEPISNDSPTSDKSSTSMDSTNNINITPVQENSSLKAPEFSNPGENNVVEDIMAEEIVTNEIITTNSPQNINIQETSHRLSPSPVSVPIKLNISQISPTKLPNSIGGFPVPKLPILEDSFVDLSPPSPEDEPQTQEYDFTNTENIYANCSTQPFVESDAKRDRLVEEDDILGDLASNDATTLLSTENPLRPQASTSTRSKENRKRKPRKTSTKRKRKTVMTTSASPSTLATTSTIPLISTSQNIETPVSSSLQPSTSENQFSTTEPSTTALEREPKISSTMSTRKRLARKTQESTVKQTVATKSSKTDINPSTSTSLNEESSAILPSLQSMETENQTLTTEPTTANISTTSTAETENLLSTKSTRRRKPRKTSESNAKQQKSKNISGNRKNKSTELNISTNESKTMSTRSKDVGNSCTVARKETTQRKKIKLEKEQMEIGNTGLNDLTNSEPTRRTRKKQISVKQEVQTNDDVINIAQPELPALNNSEDFETKKERNLEMKPSSHHSLKFETRKRRKQPTVPSGEPHVYSPAKRIKTEIKSAQLALRPRRVKPKIMFTGVVDELGEKIVKDLGGHMTDDVQECTHLITDKIRRTVKFLCALVRGAFILNQDWLRESKMQMRFLPEEDYELTDDNNASTNSSTSNISSTSNHSLEDQFNFNLHQSLQKSRSHSLPLFHDLRIHATKSVLPPLEQMYSIIGCGGGQVMKKMPCSFDDNVIIVASETDSKICATALKVGAKIVSSEFILTGILRQKLEPDNFRLFQDNSTSSKATSSTTRSARVRKARK